MTARALDADQALEARLESYRRLADVFHSVLSEQTLEALLETIADALADLIPYETLVIYEADERKRLLVPVLARDQWAEEILKDRVLFGEGITGWGVDNRTGVLANDAHLDPRAMEIPGTPFEPDSLISVPLVAADSIKGALNIYRNGEGSVFSEEDFELAKRFGDAVALALDNTQSRARLERLAHTDSLTGLHNHRYFYERLRSELARAGRARDTVTLLMLDIDDFKRLNDVYGHALGDQVLITLADMLRQMVRASDVVSRIGGEELAIIMPSSDAGAALGLASRLLDRLAATELEPAGPISVSLGVAQGPHHAMNARELVACAEAAMMTAKARGKRRVVLFDEENIERPGASSTSHDVRSIAHLKMLQSLAGKLNRLNDLRQIGTTIANELRTLIDYSACRVYVVDNDDLIPIALRGEHDEYENEDPETLACKVGEGITGRAAATGESLLIANALECDFAVDIPDTDDIDESMIAVPLSYGTRVIGVIVMSKLGVNQFDQDDVRLLEVLAGQASVALENARLYEAQKESLEIANALLEFSRDLSLAEGLTEVLMRIVEQSAKSLGSTKTAVWLQELETGDLVPEAYWGYEGDELEEIKSLRIPEEVARRFLEATEPFVVSTETVDEVRAEITDAPPNRGFVYAVAPLRLDGERMCAISAATHAEQGQQLSSRKMRLLAGIADQAKVAIMNANSFENLERTFVSTVEALANALEAKDEYTSTHAREITDLALEVGRRLGLDDSALKRLELGALFHDIGKIGIPSHILLKAGPLDDDEWSVIKTHPELGERILAPIDRLSEVGPIVRHCHEHYDGRGYPDGKAADDIPIESRIVLVCDAYHAMTTNRPYRKRLSDEEAFSRLENSAGTQFDPKVVDAFLQVV